MYPKATALKGVRVSAVQQMGGGGNVMDIYRPTLKLVLHLRAAIGCGAVVGCRVSPEEGGTVFKLPLT